MPASQGEMPRKNSGQVCQLWACISGEDTDPWLRTSGPPHLRFGAQPPFFTSSITQQNSVGHNVGFPFEILLNFDLCHELTVSGRSLNLPMREVETLKLWHIVLILHFMWCLKQIWRKEKEEKECRIPPEQALPRGWPPRYFTCHHREVPWRLLTKSGWDYLTLGFLQSRPETRTWMKVIYLGGNPRKPTWGSGWDQEGKKANKGWASLWVTTMDNLLGTL